MLRRYIYLSLGIHLALAGGLAVSSSNVSVNFDIRRGLSALKVEVKEEKAEKKKALPVRPKEFTILVVPGGSFIVNRSLPAHERRGAEKKHNENIGALHKRASFNSKNFPPHYPDTARRIGYQGTVILSIEILPTGRTGRVRVLQSSGTAMLDDSAVRAARRWVFFLPREMELDAAITVEQKFTFQLNSR